MRIQQVVNAAPQHRCGGGSFPCWKVQSSTGCTSGHSLAIDYNGAPPPPNPVYTASCTVLAR